MSIPELINTLARWGVTFKAEAGGKWKVRLPWKKASDIPEPALVLLHELDRRREEVDAWFMAQAVVMRQPVELHPARRECLEVNTCLWLSTGCGWYAVITQDGLLASVCRDRVQGRVLH